jgi:hypothetical protein
MIRVTFLWIEYGNSYHTLAVSQNEINPYNLTTVYQHRRFSARSHLSYSGIFGLLMYFVIRPRRLNTTVNSVIARLIHRDCGHYQHTTE